MSLLTVVVALFIWLSISFFLARIFTKWVRSPFRIGAIFIVTMIIFTLPAVDEIIGKYQFKSLCAKNSIVHISDNVEGRIVYLMDTPDSKLEGYILPVKAQIWKFADIKNNEIVIDYKVLYSRGGFLGGGLHLTDDGGPVIFNGICRPQRAIKLQQMLDDLKVDQVKRPSMKFK